MGESPNIIHCYEIIFTYSPASPGRPFDWTPSECFNVEYLR